MDSEVSQPYPIFILLMYFHFHVKLVSRFNGNNNNILKTKPFKDLDNSEV